MPNGVDRRSQIDTETLKALLVINGGGAIALLTLLPSMIGKTEYHEMTRAILFGLLSFMSGLFFAVVYNILRRKCSLLYEQQKMRAIPGHIFGIELPSPTVCFISSCSMWLSVAAFFFAGSYVAVRGLILIQT